MSPGRCADSEWLLLDPPAASMMCHQRCRVTGWGTAEVESAPQLLTRDVSEAAVVGFPHQIKGTGHLRPYRDLDERVRSLPAELRKELVSRGVRKGNRPELPPPTVIQFAAGIAEDPLRKKSCAEFCAKIAEKKNEFGALGDTSDIGRSSGRR